MHATITKVDARVGTVLAGKYRIHGLLGTGGMGAVYEAEHLTSKRRVAIKVMLREAMDHPQAVRRFLREAQAAARIAHPNIVVVLHVGRNAEDGTLYIAQELLAGADLRQTLERDRRLTPRATLEALVPIMHALANAHRHGIIHRDIKPENIFLAKTPDGKVVPKLIDFGVSKIIEVGRESLGLTKSGMLLGTPFYMSPEQARGTDGTSPLTDVWAIGVVFFETLTGFRPFLSENYNALILEILTAQVPRLDQVAPDVPVPLADIIERALARDADRRFTSMAEFLGVLCDCPVFQQDEWFQTLVEHYRNPEEMPPGAPSMAPFADTIESARTSFEDVLALADPESLRASDESSLKGLAAALAPTLPGSAAPAADASRVSARSGTPLAWSKTEPSHRRLVVTGVVVALFGVAALLVTVLMSPRVRPLARVLHMDTRAVTARPQLSTASVDPARSVPMADVVTGPSTPVAPEAPRIAATLGGQPAPQLGSNPARTAPPRVRPARRPGSGQSQSALPLQTPLSPQGPRQGALMRDYDQSH